MKYINGSYRGILETIDEFPTYSEARKMLIEYRLAFGGDWRLWISQRACKGWDDDSQA